LKQVCNCLGYYSPYCGINGFTRAALMDLGKTPRDDDLLTIFVIGLIRTSRHVGIRSTAQKALDDMFSNCLISVSVKSSNVSIMDMQDYSTYPVIRCWDGTHYIYLIFFDRRRY